MKVSNFFALISLTIMAVIFFFILFDANNLHFYPDYLNDQIGYISVSRHLVDFGHFIEKYRYQGVGSVILPGFLNIENSRLYMPGYFIFLAFFYKLFGVSNFTSILPSLISFFCSTILIYFIANHLYGLKTAKISALLFLFFPLNIFLAFTAMSELTLVFICLLTFTIFILLPEKLKLYSIPFLLCISYLFRQTEAFLLIPFLAYLYDRKSIKNLFQMGLIIIITIIFFHTLDVWQKHQGLYGINLIEFLENQHINYANAFPEHHPASSLLDISKLFLLHSWRSIILLISNFLDFNSDNQVLVILSAWEIIFFMIMAIAFSLNSAKRELFPISCVMLIILLFLACIFLYTGALITVLRQLMFAIPFIIMQSANFIVANFNQKNLLSFLNKDKSKYYSFFGLYLTLTIVAVFCSSFTLRKLDKLSYQYNRFIESIQPAENMLLVSRPSFTKYNYIHYPQLIAYIPENRQTLFLLNKQFPIGTLIISDPELGKAFTVEDINSLGLTFTGHREFKGKNYSIFKRI